MKNNVFKIGDRVTISTNGSSPGTVIEFVHGRVVVQIDGEPGPRLCLKENVSLITG
jgi:hypothetical protein